jgi:hypothetical protein
MFIEVVENGAIANLFAQPGKISGDAEIAPGAANNRGVIRLIPRTHGFSRHIIAGMMFVHSAFVKNSTCQMHNYRKSIPS